MNRLFVTITLDQVLNRYWELANLDVEATKGSITGQLKALDSLCELLALRTEKQAPVSLRPEGVYRSAWMTTTKPGREN